MPEVKFYLKDPLNKKEKQLIYLFFSFSGQRLKYSTGEQIPASQWNSISQKARSNNDLNDFLNKLSEDTVRIERQLRTGGKKVTTQLLRDKLDELLERKTTVRQDLFSFIESYISTVAKKESTLKGYRNTFKHLVNFKNLKKRKFDFEDINLDFYDEFNNYLSQKMGFKINTIGKQFKNIKVFLNEASERGYTTNNDYRNRKFKVLSEEVDSVYLNEKEIECLFNLDLTNISNGYIKIKTIKMNKPVVIPIHKFVARIMRKYEDEYENSLPPALSNQKMNEYLKEIGILAELTEKVQVSHFIRGKRVDNVFLKSQLISTHTARRSFATNLYLADFPTISIMAITGHKTERAFLKYIKVTPEQHAQKLQKFWESKLT
ncbi:MAG: tyrosine type site-specific recombinase [Bacteroidota bacterium]|nr:tyrosine type site-specific recombinase [Bacteroidota bacterium]